MTRYDEIMNQAKRLTPDEQLRLIAYLSEQARLTKTQKLKEPKRWRDLRGAVAYPLVAEDAQAWVSASRQDDDEHRHQPSKSQML